MDGRRSLVVQQIADRVVGIRRAHPVRVAIDGIDAAGKTILADELSAAVYRQGRPVIRASIDGFHRPRDERYSRGSDSPDGYYRDSFDHDALRRELLDPLGPGGDLRYRTAAFDHLLDAPVESPADSARPDAVVIVDGVYLQIPALRDAWDVTVWVEVSFETSLQRALRRDVPDLGSAVEVRGRYLARYHPGQRLYLEECDPAGRADWVIVNDRPEEPVLHRPGAFDPGDRTG